MEIKIIDQASVTIGNKWGSVAKLFRNAPLTATPDIIGYARTQDGELLAVAVNVTERKR